jgi:hypothetical protein
MSYHRERVEIIKSLTCMLQSELREWARQELSAWYYFSESKFWPRPPIGDRKFVKEEIRFVNHDGKELCRYTQLDLIWDTGLLLVGHGNG